MIERKSRNIRSRSLSKRSGNFSGTYLKRRGAERSCVLGFLPRLEGRTAKLVLPATPVAPLERTRKESFVLRQLLNSLAAGAAASISFAMNGAPAFADALVFVWLIFPASILLLSSTGKLMPAEAMASLSFIAAGLTAAFGGGVLHPTAFAWLISRQSKVFSP